MGACGETSAGDVQGWYHAVGDNLGENGPLPKREGGYQVIGMVEVLWKVCSLVVNCCLKRSVVFYNAHHGFR